MSYSLAAVLGPLAVQEPDIMLRSTTKWASGCKRVTVLISELELKQVVTLCSAGLYIHAVSLSEHSPPVMSMLNAQHPL